MKFSKKKAIIFLFITGLISICCLYLISKYTQFSQPITSIQIELDKHTIEKGVPILYANKNNSAKINFQTVYRFKKLNDSIVELNNLGDFNISKFRVYFEFPGKNFSLKKIVVLNRSESQEISLDKIKHFGKIAIHDETHFDVTALNGYLEYPFIIVNKIPYLKIIIVIFFLATLLYLFLNKTTILDTLLKAKKNEYLFILFILSIYSFSPIYNIALILALLFYIKDFNWVFFKENKINILFVILFLIYLINNIFINSDGFNEYSTVVRFLPFVFIPILMASFRFGYALYYFMLSGFFIGFILFSLSFIDFNILNKYEYFSFEEFSKYYHPVYLSYLFFIIICYLQQYYHKKEKYLFQSIFLIFLIFLGSKLVLVIGIPLYFIFFINSKKKTISFALLSIGFIVLITIFKPLQLRFKEVANIDDLSILKENKLQNSNDSRINGLTFRLILWRETLATMNGFSEFVFGNGVSKSKSKDLKARLENLGLFHHKGFNPHNQYIDTFWKTGFVGLFILLLIFLIAFKTGFESKNKFLLFFTTFITISLLTESIYGRVRGVYLVTTVLLILTNTNFDYKIKQKKVTNI